MNNNRRGGGPQMHRGHSRYGGVKEKPRNTKDTLKRLISYISKNKNKGRRVRCKWHLVATAPLFCL